MKNLLLIHTSVFEFEETLTAVQLFPITGEEEEEVGRAVMSSPKGDI